jgi:intracellular sulfur oxidation DsrE/DsrF family protein
MAFLVSIWLFMPASLAVAANDDSDYPELADIQAMVNAKKPPEGIVFVVNDYNEDALEWVTPRLLRYVDLLRARYPELPVSVVSHGDEILALTTEQRELYSKIHKDIQKLVNKYHVRFHVCGAFAAFNGLSNGDFPSYIDVVPFGPSQIADYRMVGFVLMDLELTW